MYVRTLPDSRQRVVVTEEQAQQIEAEWAKINFRRRWLSPLAPYGVTEADLDHRKDALSRKFGREASDRDAVWSLFNAVVAVVARVSNFNGLKMLYFEMALFVGAEGKDPFHLLQQSQKMELMRYKGTLGFTGVEIFACEDSCEACRKLDRKVFTIEEALEKMPIPCRECTNPILSDDWGWCRCFYGVVVEEAEFDRM